MKDRGCASGSKDAHGDHFSNDVTHREYEHKSLCEIEADKDKMHMLESEQTGMMLQSEGQGCSWMCEELKKKEILTEDELKMAMNKKNKEILTEMLTEDELKMTMKKKNKEILTEDELKMTMKKKKKKEILSDDDLKMIMKKKMEMLTDDESKIERIYEEYELVTAEMYKDRDLYLAAINGNLSHFGTILDLVDSEDDILSRLTVNGNTFIHVAAKHGNKDIVEFLVRMKPSFVLAKNFDGETVLHIAVKRKDEPMVETLLRSLFRNEREKHDLLMAENETGNTALHQALLGGDRARFCANISPEQPSRICHLFGS